MAIDQSGEEPDPEVMQQALLAMGPWLIALLVAALVLSLLSQISFFWTLRRAAITMQLENFEGIESIAQNRDRPPGTGEGLADAFDLGSV
jgi:hypothetical protein